MLWLLAIKSTKYIGRKKKKKQQQQQKKQKQTNRNKNKNKNKKQKTKKKTRNFDRGKCLGSPHNGYGPAVTRDKWKWCQSHEQLTWFGTSQQHWNHQGKSDWPLFGGSFILNLDNTVDWRQPIFLVSYFARISNISTLAITGHPSLGN